MSACVMTIITGDLLMLAVNIIMLHIDMSSWHVDIIDIYLGCREQKYVTIALRLHM